MKRYPAVEIREEGLREGMQIESIDITVEDKIRLLEALSDTGLRHIVVGSFVSPKWTPQMADIEKVIRGFEPRDGVRYTALALNQKGVERRREFVPPLSDESDVPPRTNVHACDVFVRRNTNRSQAREIERWPAVIEQARAQGFTEGGIGVNAAWGSNWLGEFTLPRRMDLLERQWRLWDAAGMRVTRVFLGDPMGWNMPDRVAEQLSAIRERWPLITTFHLHLHNTRGSAPISTYAALQALDPGCTLVLDSTVGGIGGCPYCGNGRVTGMVPTEDLVDLLEELGIPTGIDIGKLVECAVLAEEIIGRPLDGHVSKAGPRPRGDALYPMDMPLVETREQAQHFRLGPSVYEDGLRPWREPVRSPARPVGSREGEEGAR